MLIQCGPELQFEPQLAELCLEINAIPKLCRGSIDMHYEEFLFELGIIMSGRTSNKISGVAITSNCSKRIDHNRNINIVITIGYI